MQIKPGRLLGGGETQFPEEIWGNKSEVMKGKKELVFMEGKYFFVLLNLVSGLQS